MRFDHKVVLITGGGTGIGFGIARKFAREGAQVAIVARNVVRAEQAAETLRSEGLKCAAFQADATDEDQIKAALGSIIEVFGGLDILVNNAGCGLMKSPLSPKTPAAQRWAFYREANLGSCYLMTAQCLKHLAQRPGGAVVNISSTATHHGNWGLYGVAKAGVEAMTRSFAAEAAPLGIRVNCVSPGWIETSPQQAAELQGQAGWEHPPSLFNRMGTPDEIAGAVCFFASDEASFVTGQTLIVDGGMMAIDYPSRSFLSQAGHRGMSQSAEA